MMSIPIGIDPGERFKACLLSIPFLFFPAFLSGASLVESGKEDSNSLRSLGLSFSYTSTLAHTPEVNEVRGARPIGITASYQYQFLDSLTWEHCGCNPRTGILGGYFYLDDPETLGNSYFLAGSVEPFLWTGKKVDLSIRGVFGGTYMDNPYHAERNPENKAYSTHLSFFLQLGLHGHIRIGPRSTLKVSALYDHASNGGVAKPNKGLNHPGVQIGYERSFSPTRFPERPAPERSAGGGEPRLDLSFFGGGKTIGSDRETYYGFGGHAIDLAYPLSSLHTLTLGAEWTVDGALKEKIRERGKKADHQRGGITLGHEFLMGRFIFSQGIGVYFYNPSGLDDPIYHRWGLDYYITPDWSLGISLKAHRHIADLIDLRITRSIGYEQGKEAPVR